MSGMYLGLVALLAGMLWVIAPPSVVKPQDTVGAALLVYLCLIFLKVLLDDAVHFNDKKKNETNWTHGLGLCIVWNLLILNAMRVAAGDQSRSLMYATLGLLVGTVWIIQNYIHKPEVAPDDKQRHIGWAYLNVLNIAVLCVLNTYLTATPTWLKISLFVALSVLVVYDALRFGTLRRVANSFN